MAFHTVESCILSTNPGHLFYNVLRDRDHTSGVTFLLSKKLPFEQYGCG